jgi:NAD(P)-dependent dehydrogenase (short-subunit alcohol dehydrogenase family)
MENKICIVTGANSGIGKQTALGLAGAGATVVMVCRSQERGEQARAEIAAATGSDKLDLLLADLSSRESVRQVVAEFNGRYPHLDILINNAGAYFNQRYESVDGLELTFALNHMGYFWLTNGLLPALQKSNAARIINVSSDAHRMVSRLNFDDLQSQRAFRGFNVYAQSKLANILFTYELARRLPDGRIAVNVLHPGVVKSNFGANNTGVVAFLFAKVVNLFGVSEKKGAETPLYLATAPETAGITAGYFANKRQIKSSAASYDKAAARRLWEMSESLSA